jgi:hypothetical protein
VTPNATAFHTRGVALQVYKAFVVVRTYGYLRPAKFDVFTPRMFCPSTNYKRTPHSLDNHLQVESDTTPPTPCLRHLIPDFSPFQHIARGVWCSPYTAGSGSGSPTRVVGDNLVREVWVSPPSWPTRIQDIRVLMCSTKLLVFRNSSQKSWLKTDRQTDRHTDNTIIPAYEKC